MDIETTGPVNQAMPGNYFVQRSAQQIDEKIPVHEIIELGIVQLDMSTGGTSKVYLKRFKPCASIVSSATRLHKLTMEDLVKEGSFKDEAQ